MGLGVIDPESPPVGADDVEDIDDSVVVLYVLSGAIVVL